MMNIYKIEISYKTGNSFNSENKKEFLEYEWTVLEAAKKSLEHIKNHYEFYQKHNTEYTKPKEKLPDGVIWDNEYRMIMLVLVDNNNKPYRYSCFWTGYFETLYSAKIKILNSIDDGMEYIP